MIQHKWAPRRSPKPTDDAQSNPNLASSPPASSIRGRGGWSGGSSESQVWVERTEEASTSKTWLVVMLG